MSSYDMKNKLMYATYDKADLCKDRLHKRAPYSDALQTTLYYKYVTTSVLKRVAGPTG